MEFCTQKKRGSPIEISLHLTLVLWFTKDCLKFEGDTCENANVSNTICLLSDNVGSVAWYL